MATSRRLGIKGALLLLAAGVAGQAPAAMPGLYFAGFYMDSTLGYSTVDASAAGFDPVMLDAWEAVGATVQSWDSTLGDRSDIGYAFSLGFQFNEFLAAEAGWVDMGTINYESYGQVSSGSSVYSSQTFLNAKTTGLMLAGIGIWPMGDRWSLDARGGVFLSKTRMRALLAIDNTLLYELRDSDKKNALVVGAGVNFAFSPGTAMRLGYTHHMSTMVDKYDIGAWTFGLKYAW